MSTASDRPQAPPPPDTPLLATLARAVLDAASGDTAIDWNALTPPLAEDLTPFHVLLDQALCAAAYALMSVLHQTTSANLRDLLVHSDSSDDAATALYATQLVAALEDARRADKGLAATHSAVHELLRDNVVEILTASPAGTGPSRAHLTLLRPMVEHVCAEHGTRVHWDQLSAQLDAAHPATAWLTETIGHAACYAALPAGEAPLLCALRHTASRRLNTDLELLRSTGLATQIPR